MPKAISVLVCLILFIVLTQFKNLCTFEANACVLLCFARRSRFFASFQSSSLRSYFSPFSVRIMHVTCHHETISRCSFGLISLSSVCIETPEPTNNFQPSGLAATFLDIRANPFAEVLGYFSFMPCKLRAFEPVHLHLVIYTGVGPLPAFKTAVRCSYPTMLPNNTVLFG